MSSLGPQSQSTTPAAEEWRAHWARTIPQLEQLSRQLGSNTQDVSIMRSSQLDAARLDDELSGMLKEQFTKVFALFRPGVVASFQAELTLLLDFLIFWFSVRKGRPLPGMALMNLRYRDERAVLPAPLLHLGPPPQQAAQQGQPTASLPCSPALTTDAAASPLPSSSSAAAALPSSTPTVAAVGGGGVLAVGGRDGGAVEGAVVGGGRSGVDGPGLTAGQRGLYCLGAVLLKYGWGRLTHHAAASHWGEERRGGWRRAGWVLLRRAESGYRLGALLNFLVFLRTGKYRSLLERLLRARLVYGNPSAARAISFEYLNRQLVWSELSELLLFLLPLLDVAALKRAVRAHLPRIPALAGGAFGAAAVAALGDSGSEAQQRQQPCGICGTAPVPSPWSALPCRHRFCYYCLRSHCQADPRYTCPLCLERVAAMERCVEAAATPPRRKDSEAAQESVCVWVRVWRGW